MFSEKLRSITKACMLTEQIFKKVIENFPIFSIEREVSDFIASETSGLGLKPAFKTIVGSTPGGSEPHHVPSLPLKRGFCVIDFGVKINGYCSDFTRTVFLGVPSDKELNLYKLVQNAQNAGVNAVKSGVMGKDAYFAASKELGVYAGKFIHGLGHGVGKRIHVKPYLKKTSGDVLKENDIITIEPGVYFKDEFGVRVEDVFLVTKEGCEKITAFSTDLIVLPLT